MAKDEIKVPIGFDVDKRQISKEANKVEREFEEAGRKSSKKFQSGFSSVFKGAFFANLATQALTRMVAGFGEFRELAAVQEKAEKQLSSALGKNIDNLKEYASSLQKVTTFGDEQILQGQSLLAAFVKDEEQLKKITKATLDLAAAKGMDLNTAFDLVAKTVGSSTNALSRYGIEVKGAANSEERMGNLVENVTKLYKGQAEALAQTDAGKIIQVENAFGDFKEQLGAIINQLIAELGPTLLKLVDTLSKTLVPVLQRVLITLAPLVTTLIEKLAPILDELIVSLMPVFEEALNSMIPIFIDLLNAIMPVVTMLLKLATKVIPLVMKIMKPFYDYIVKIINAMTSVVKWIGSLFGAMDDGDDTQEEHRKQLSDTEQQYYDLALGIDEAKGSQDEFNTSVEDGKKIVENAAPKIKEYADGLRKIDELGGSFDYLSKKIKESDIGSRAVFSNLQKELRKSYDEGQLTAKGVAELGKLMSDLSTNKVPDLVTELEKKTKTTKDNTDADKGAALSLEQLKKKYIELSDGIAKSKLFEKILNMADAKRIEKIRIDELNKSLEKELELRRQGGVTLAEIGEKENKNLATKAETRKETEKGIETQKKWNTIAVEIPDIEIPSFFENITGLNDGFKGFIENLQGLGSTYETLDETQKAVYQTTMQLGSAFGEMFTSILTGQKSFLQGLGGMLLESIDMVVNAMLAEALARSLASAESVASFGIMGMLKFSLIAGLIKAGVAGLKSAVGAEEGTDFMNSLFSHDKQATKKDTFPLWITPKEARWGVLSDRALDVGGRLATNREVAQLMNKGQSAEDVIIKRYEAQKFNDMNIVGEQKRTNKQLEILNEKQNKLVNNMKSYHNFRFVNLPKEYEVEEIDYWRM